MAISQVIKFAGSTDDLVWKYAGEEFNATSQLIVDETHQALLVVNGQAADLFGPGVHTLSVPNLPLLKRIINIPTGGESPFPCKVFYINQVHQMDMLWGTRGPITLNDPLYDIFLHVMLHGSMTFSISDSRKFLIKLAGFRNRFTSAEMLDNFKGLVSSHVKDCISKIMINGMLSYFMINANLFDISESVKERLDTIFDEYGIRVEYFNIETIEVPKEDYEAVTKSKERRSGRIIEGYTWQEERQMMIAEKFAANEGTMGGVGGAMGGFLVGGAFAGSIGDIAKAALTTGPKAATPPKDLSEMLKPTMPVIPGAPAQATPQATPAVEDTNTCPQCGHKVTAGSKFCSECGCKIPAKPSFCTNCGNEVQPGSKFCNECGTKL